MIKIGRIILLGWISVFLAIPSMPESGGLGIQQISQSAEPEKSKTSESSSAGGPQTVAGKSREISTLGKKRGLSPWIIGGAAVAGGVLAYFLFFKPKSSAKVKTFNQQTSLSSSVEIKAGNISVQSSPPGAAIFLDGAATGKTTPATFERIIVGTYALKLTKEGFKDFTTSVEIAADQTANVEAALSGHNIQVQAPAAESFLETGRTVSIRWASDAASVVQTPSVSEVLYMPEVAIALFQNGEKTAMIAERTPNDGAFDWTIPPTLRPGRNFQIVVYCPSSENIQGAGGTFIIAARKTTKIEYHPDLHEDELDPGWNSYPAEIKKASGRIESFSYEVEAGHQKIDCTMYLVGQDGSQIIIFDRDQSQWKFNTKEHGWELRLFGWAPIFKDLAVKGLWTLKVQVHTSDCCCIGRGGCGSISWSATVEYLEF
jgi:hypothetical protein